MATREHTTASRTEYALGGATMGAIFGGILGLAAVVAVPGLVLGAAFGPIAGWVAAGAGALFFGAPAAAIGAATFGAKGALSGLDKANQEDSRYVRQKEAYREARQDALAEARGAAAEQYTMAGYQAAAAELAPYYFEQGQQSVVQQIIAAKQQEQMAAQQHGHAHHQHGEKSFAQNCGKHPKETHAQTVVENQAQSAIAGQTI